MKKLLPLAVLAALSSVHVASAQAADVSAAVGATGQSGMTYRLGLSWDWDKSWWQTSTGRLTGYWDAGYTYWEGGDEGAGKHSLSFAPVFVYEFAGDSIKPFIEAGIGVAAFSGTRVGDQNLGSSLNFEDRIGAGLKFANGQSVGVRAIHYSNAGLKQPNDGSSPTACSTRSRSSRHGRKKPGSSRLFHACDSSTTPHRPMERASHLAGGDSSLTRPTRDHRAAAGCGKLPAPVRGWPSGRPLAVDSRPRRTAPGWTDRGSPCAPGRPVPAASGG